VTHSAERCSAVNNLERFNYQSVKQVVGYYQIYSHPRQTILHMETAMMRLLTGIRQWLQQKLGSDQES